jgi:hypothetical protein
VWTLVVILAVAAPRATPPPGDGVYEVAAVTGLGTQVVTSRLVLSTRRTGPSTWTVATTTTETSWEDPAGAVRFDSHNRRHADPWPLVAVHEVGALPADVGFDGDGAPERLLDDDAWARRVIATLDALDVPGEPVEGGVSLADPSGFLADLRRSFPGVPAEDWRRRMRVAGVEADRFERCERRREAGLTRYSCDGTLSVPVGAGAILHDAVVTSEVALDRRGLVWLEERWSGTVVRLDAQGAMTDAPFAGVRRVERR